jgi:hypothetical protein
MQEPQLSLAVAADNLNESSPHQFDLAYIPQRQSGNATREM